MGRGNSKGLTFFGGGLFFLGEDSSELAKEGLPYIAGAIGEGWGRGDTIGAMFAYIGVLIRSPPPGVSALKLDDLGGAITSPRAIASASL